MKLWQCKECKLAWEGKSLFSDFFTPKECPNCESNNIFYGDWPTKRSEEP